MIDLKDVTYLIKNEEAEISLQDRKLSQYVTRPLENFRAFPQLQNGVGRNYYLVSSSWN